MSTMTILGQPVVMTANGSIEPLKILKSFVNDDNFLVEIPLVIKYSTTPLARLRDKVMLYESEPLLSVCDDSSMIMFGLSFNINSRVVSIEFLAFYVKRALLNS